MSLKFSIEITRPARADFRDILSFTLQSWGQDQMLEYKQRINNALYVLAENPDLGRQRHGVKVYHVGRRRIFYRMAGTTIFILRILHDRMDAGRYLSEE